MTPRPLVERVSLRRVSPGLGFVDVRLPAVHLCSLRVEQQRDGTLAITPPTQADRNGRPWPLYALQPGTREAVEAAVRDVWARSA